MAITLTDKDISTRYALQEDFDDGFLGRDRQIVIKTDDPKGYRPIIMDGVTSGGKNKVALVEDLTDYLTKTEGSSTYATKAQAPTITTGTEDLTAGSSSLATGTYHFVYE